MNDPVFVGLDIGVCRSAETAWHQNPTLTQTYIDSFDYIKAQHSDSSIDWCLVHEIYFTYTLESLVTGIKCAGKRSFEEIRDVEGDAWQLLGNISIYFTSI